MEKKIEQKAGFLAANWHVVLIDPVAQTVSNAAINSWRDIKEFCQCDCLTTLLIDETNAIWLDDEGLIRLGGPRGLFEWAGYAQPLAGRAVITGLTVGEGDLCSTSFDAAKVASVVRWRPDLVFDRMETSEGVTQVPGLGPVATIRSEAKFKKNGE